MNRSKNALSTLHRGEESPAGSGPSLTCDSEIRSIICAGQPPQLLQDGAQQIDAAVAACLALKAQGCLPHDAAWLQRTPSDEGLFELACDERIPRDVRVRCIAMRSRRIVHQFRSDATPPTGSSVQAA